MTGTVYGRLESTNRLIVDAQVLARQADISTGTFTAASDAVARGELAEADSLLETLESKIDNEDVCRHVRDARQLIIGLQEEWSE